MNPYQKVKHHLNFFERITQATYSQLLLLWVEVNASFALLYFALATTHAKHAPTMLAGMPPLERFLNSLYFSVVTATSTGYGDIVPQGASKALAMIQCILALMVFAVFVTKLVTRKQDVALHEVHRMTFEGIFYHIRQGLFTVRKDFDMLMQEADRYKTLTDRDWERLSTAYLQAQSLIEEIPDLYNGQLNDLYTMDLKRERLLFEAIHRTLQRIDVMLRTFDQDNIDWMGHEESTHELHVFIETVDTIMPLWRERSPFHEVKEFEDIYTLGSQLHTDIKKALKK